MPKNLDEGSAQKIALSSLPSNQRARIYCIEGGHGFRRKLQVMGIRKGETIKVITKQPFRGPLTVEICGSQMTVGRGMAHKILVEVIG